MPGLESCLQAATPLPPTTHMLTSSCVTRPVVTCIPRRREDGSADCVSCMAVQCTFCISSRNVVHSLRLAIALPHNLTTARCTVVIAGFRPRSAGLSSMNNPRSQEEKREGATACRTQRMIHYHCTTIFTHTDTPAAKRVPGSCSSEQTSIHPRHSARHTSTHAIIAAPRHTPRTSGGPPLNAPPPNTLNQANGGWPPAAPQPSFHCLAAAANRATGASGCSPRNPPLKPDLLRWPRRG